MLIQLLLPIELKLNSNMKGLKFGHFGSMLIPHKQKNTSLIVGFNTIKIPLFRKLNKIATRSDVNGLNLIIPPHLRPFSHHKKLNQKHRTISIESKPKQIHQFSKSTVESILT